MTKAPQKLQNDVETSLPNASQKVTGGEGRPTDIIVAEAVGELLNALGSGNSKGIEEALTRLGVNKESNLHSQVDHMARSLHESLKEFKASLNRDNLTMHSTNMPDAADKLEGVIKLTYEAAEKVMNVVDQQCLIIKHGRERLAQMRSQMQERPDIPSDLKTSLLDAISAEEKSWNIMEEKTTEILIAQEFQDLTGQALRKVVKLVTGLETQMASLIKLFGIHDEVTTGEVAVKQTDNLAQDETDELLKNFGF